jgi:hypothetical protein
MAKKVHVEIPRSTLLELAHDTEFSLNLYNAILEVENTGEPTTVSVGKAKQRATVSVSNG